MWIDWYSFPYFSQWDILYTGISEAPPEGKSEDATAIAVNVRKNWQSGYTMIRLQDKELELHAFGVPVIFLLFPFILFEGCFFVCFVIEFT